MPKFVSMGNRSIIYRNIHYYRFVMNVLYTSGYQKRLDRILSIMNLYTPKKVLELCFADTYIARYCRASQIEWTGLDINPAFVAHARREQFDADEADLSRPGPLPKAGLCIISGSLYHFHDQLPDFLQRVLRAAPVLILSEPVRYLSSSKGIVGWIAQKLSNAGKGKEDFRFTAATLQDALNQLSSALNFKFSVHGYYKKDIFIVIEQNATFD
jgi:hypothetical protein